MAGKERGLFQLIFKHFIRSITPTYNKHVLVGTDYYGTKYYEVKTETQSIHKHKKINRYFVPVNKNDFEQEMPAEWEAWLRNRRDKPPTEAEMIENYDMIVMKRKNAAELEATYAKDAETQVVNPNAKPLTQHTSLNFPTYDEYRNHGRNYKPKIKY